MPLLRGQVYWATFDERIGEKPWLVVSNNQRNARLGSALVVRVTTSPKPPLASIVELTHEDPLAGRVLCDDITVLYSDEPYRLAGTLSQGTMRAVDAALKVALALTVSAFTVSAAVEKAENIVARAESTIMPAQQFDAMIAALDDPTPIPQIVALANRSHRIDRA